ncbi:cytochrome c biogenesis protein CcmG, thiol:disulfide interchange protein DsbE [Mariprofundus micogutta]|uniref:Cytochrome c biogenesis protein CcmG, thiol:disulfide interchange protein DsbE n=1 Tax=Mariprofundus micogutta TaxID=1921010 RepID=A0A1L8CKZ5_9PROT|nr:TlpA disulfide reductase family protein [Mariprofundus micogutta]GAV19572.1 cytochrome c biogenesis protein CcmG, thiol:disulfide interchange protein DsbE [Mariprofundus micogutta]
MMKYRWLLVLGIVAGMGAIVWLALPKATTAAMKQGPQLAALQLPDLKGQLHGIIPKGEVVLLNFWATWCPPCRKEIPSMAELHNRYAGKGLKIIAVSVDKHRDDLITFVNEHDMPFQVLHDGTTYVSQQFGVFRFPESFLIGKDGKIRHHLIGAVDWESQPVLDSVEQMLSEPFSGVVSGESQPDNS